MFWMKLRTEVVGTFQVDLMLLQDVVTATGTADSGGVIIRGGRRGSRGRKEGGRER